MVLSKSQAHRKRYCFNMVMAVTTLTGRPCESAWSFDTLADQYPSKPFIGGPSKGSTNFEVG